MTKFSSLVVPDLILFCSFIISHPLYFSYCVFFSPFLLKILSFLSPLFITTFLLLLVLLNFSPTLIQDKAFTDGNVSFLFATYRTVKESLRCKIESGDEEFQSLEEFEAYKLVFDTSMFDVEENPVEVMELKSEENCLQNVEAPFLECSSDEGSSLNLEENLKVETKWGEMGENRLEEFFRGLDEFESRNCSVSVMKVEPNGAKSDKVIEESKQASKGRSGSEAVNKNLETTTVLKVNTDDGRVYTPKMKVQYQTLDGNVNDDHDEHDGEEYYKIESSRTLNYNLGSYGSMRKEKEWKRTLACKLFEERQNVDGNTDGMDLLWETYEMDSVKGRQESNTKKKIKKKSKVEYYENDYDEEEEDEDEGMVGQLCCLQALKFSAGKMNLGMGRPNIVKFSKALKGIGWLHHVGWQSKKVHNGDGF